ncbi:MFS transporter [Neobacillus sp. PS3-34]|uniref:MFS transporter n=1 Tax=Neobacillus sp. PS3-34 TaxID=3070678 RepID=UPI0027E2122A|nr:MFS transporter [Neobacillus sp. PS3-34]WML47027.1 MFS transporter [Neobacillus sp. PS3-34]
MAGSLIDRVNKRTLMITVDCIRGALVAVIPFISSVWIVYLLMFLINVAGAFFGPASNTYITKLVPTEKRKGFNSMFSFATSGAFLIAPAFQESLSCTRA